MTRNNKCYEDMLRPMLESRSAEEFMLKLSIFGERDFSFEDLSMMLDELSYRPYFIRTLSELMSKSTIFDNAVLERGYCIDGQIAATYGIPADDIRYIRFKSLMFFEDSEPDWQYISRQSAGCELIDYNSDFRILL